MKTLDELLAKVVKTETCWLWIGYLNEDGYGRVSWLSNGRFRLKYVHRLIYELMIGEISHNHDIDHICFIRNCVNPHHLRPLEARDNRKLQRESLKRYCKNGHEYTLKNTYYRPTGQRDCRNCIRIRVSKYKKKVTA